MFLSSRVQLLSWRPVLSREAGKGCEGKGQCRKRGALAARLGLWVVRAGTLWEAVSPPQATRTPKGRRRPHTGSKRRKGSSGSRTRILRDGSSQDPTEGEGSPRRPRAQGRRSHRLGLPPGPCVPGGEALEAGEAGSPRWALQRHLQLPGPCSPSLG